MSLHYLAKHEPGNCVFSVRHRHVFTHILLENVGGSEQNRSGIANVQSDDLWPSRMHAATHILQEKTHACGVVGLKRHNFRNRLMWVQSIVWNISVVFLRHSVYVLLHSLEQCPSLTYDTSITFRTCCRISTNQTVEYTTCFLTLSYLESQQSCLRKLHFLTYLFDSSLCM